MDWPSTTLYSTVSDSWVAVRLPTKFVESDLVSQGKIGIKTGLQNGPVTGSKSFGRSTVFFVRAQPISADISDLSDQVIGVNKAQAVALTFIANSEFRVFRVELRELCLQRQLVTFAEGVFECSGHTCCSHSRIVWRRDLRRSGPPRSRRSA